jgi:hypothetical protein
MQPIIFKILFFLSISVGIHASQQMLEMPKELNRTGLQNLSQITEKQLIVKFNVEEISTMQIQFESAINALKKSEKKVALFIFWDLAEKGYPAAYHELWRGFYSKSLVSDLYEDWISFFSDIHKRIPNLEYIIEMQNRMKKRMDNDLNKNESTYKLSTDSQPPTSSTLPKTDGGIRSRTLKVH